MKRRDLLAVAASTVAAPWVHAQTAAWPHQGLYPSDLPIPPRWLG